MFTFPIAHFGGALDFTIDQAIRFNDNDSASLTRTPSSAGDRRTFTFSCWVKRANLTGANQPIFTGSGNSWIMFLSGETLGINFDASGNYRIVTNQVFRDTAAWMHIVLRVDTTNATADDRLRMYVNGSQVTDFGTRTNPPLNADTDWNNTGEHRIGKLVGASQFFDGYLAEINHVDGSSLGPDSFGETNADTGQWVPVKYTGSYGTNGFHIDGRDSSDLGDDESGNGNDFSTSGLAAADQVTDSPTDNYVTLNPLQKGSDVTLSDGNLVADCGSGSSSTRAFATASMPNSGKWTFQIEAVSSTLGGTDSISSIGIITNPEATNTDVTTGSKIGQTANQENAGLDFYNGFTKKDNASQITAAQLRNAGDKGIVAYDASTKELWLGYAQSTDSSWTWVNGGDPETGTTPTYTMTNDDMRFAISSDRSKTIVRFGSTGNGIAPPSGFDYLNTANLPDPTIADPSAYFQTTLYTGTNTAIGSGGTEVNQSGNSTFQPDFVWIKSRANTRDHNLYDAVRGATKRIYSNAATAEETQTEGLASFDADGFTTGNTVASGAAENYVAWQWKANGSGSSNTDGSVTSTISHESTANFSVVKYTGTGSGNSTVGHGLGTTPDMIILKNLGRSQNWRVFHTSEGAGETGFLNDTAAFSADPDRITAVSSTTFTASANMNEARDYIAYVFAEVEGFSKFGSYTGNGSTDGVFIHTGFEVGFLMYKRTNSAESWEMYDNTRGFNVHKFNLRANLSNAEQSDVRVDLLSNGFKARSSNTAINTSGHSYIYMAFASSPFKTANAQ